MIANDGLRNAILGPPLSSSGWSFFGTRNVQEFATAGEMAKLAVKTTVTWRSLAAASNFILWMCIEKVLRSDLAATTTMRKAHSSSPKSQAAADAKSKWAKIETGFGVWVTDGKCFELGWRRAGKNGKNQRADKKKPRASTSASFSSTLGELVTSELAEAERQFMSLNSRFPVPARSLRLNRLERIFFMCVVLLMIANYVLKPPRKRNAAA